MGFSLRRSIKLAPGIRFNFGKRGASLSVGGRGLTTNINKHGSRTTVSLPGTGASYSTKRRSLFDGNSHRSFNMKTVLIVVTLLGVLYLLAG
jgi:hypothetical protein